MFQRNLVPVVLVCLLAAPSAIGWSGKGSSEPDTTHDRLDGFMYATSSPAQSPTGNYVYFNGFVIEGTAATTSESVNLASLRSGFESVNSRPAAMLGVWRDCNKDDYIGNGEANYVYRAELLLDKSLCPATPGAYPTHDDGTWIYEFIPITWNNGTL